MSVQRVKRRGQTRWEARWREGSRHRSKLFDRRGDALAWDADIRRRRQLGPLAVAQLTTATPTLKEWIAQRWAPEHGAQLELATRKCYASVYDCHVKPWLGDLPLGEITVGRLRTWQVALLDAGVPATTAQKARTLLSSVLRHAAEAEVIPGNPLVLVRAPKAPQRDRVRPLAPTTIEAIRQAMLAPHRRCVEASAAGQRKRRGYALAPRGLKDRRRDALIVSLLAYAGIRPGELHALRCRTSASAPSSSNGGPRPTARSRRPRTPEPAVFSSFRSWRASCASGD